MALGMEAIVLTFSGLPYLLERIDEYMADVAIPANLWQWFQHFPPFVLVSVTPLVFLLTGLGLGLYLAYRGYKVFQGAPNEDSDRD